MNAKRIAAVVLLGAALVLGLLGPRWWAAQYHLARVRLLYRKSDPTAAMDALLHLGSPGRRALESIAFSREIADPADPWTEVRRNALWMLWGIEVDPERIEEAKLLRYVCEARGLNRDGNPLMSPLDAVYHREDGSAAVAEAALEAALTDPHERAAKQGAFYASERDEVVAVRIAVESPYPAARIAAFSSLDPAHSQAARRTLRRALASALEPERVQAACILAFGGDRTGLPIVRAALRKAAPESDRHAPIEALARLGDRESVAPIVAFDEDGDPMTCLFGPALERLTGHKLGRGETWAAWWQAHRAEFPAQIDPDGLPVEPLVVPEGP